MGSQYPSSQNSKVPADCYNRLRLAYTKEGGYLQFAIVGMSDNLMMIGGSQWRCWNRKLGVLLISWQDFRTTARTALDQSVPCTMTIHHSYSRTVIHRIYDGVIDTIKQTEQLISETPTARILPITRHMQRPRQ